MTVLTGKALSAAPVALTKKPARQELAGHVQVAITQVLFLGDAIRQGIRNDVKRKPRKNSVG
ncbi:hypothetical protein GHO30_01550 [Pseudomonas helleri]|uniref:Uncharacterized protein n=1 Tax=Pseudomonas helleri TaxID=1608996 RepID=A0A7X2CGB7_9PSED|nr:hypothetical protein [Pseudomonas helleri]